MTCCCPLHQVPPFQWVSGLPSVILSGSLSLDLTVWVPQSRSVWVPQSRSHLLVWIKLCQLMPLLHSTELSFQKRVTVILQLAATFYIHSVLSPIGKRSIRKWNQCERCDGEISHLSTSVLLFACPDRLLVLPSANTGAVGQFKHSKAWACFFLWLQISVSFLNLLVCFGVTCWCMLPW